MITSVIPVLPVHDYAAAKTFWTDFLGFSLTKKQQGFDPGGNQICFEQDSA